MILAISVIAYVLIMLPIGLYARKKVSTSKDYVLAGRSLPFYMALATVFATWFGSESILGAGSAFAEGGFRAVIEDPFGAGLCLIIAGIFFNRKLYRLNFLTIGDYYKHRYNTLVGTFLSLVIITSYFGWVGAQFLALGLVLSGVIPGLTLPIAIIISAVLVIGYTWYGGMYSIALLDTIESVVIIVGLVAVLGYALYTIGGFGNLMDVTPPEFWNILPENKLSYTEWIIFITALMTMGLGSIPQQDIYQRAMSAKNETVSMWASILGGLLYFTIVMIPLLIALVARYVYPDVLANNPEQLILTLIRDNTPIFIQVLFFGALVSAIISTASGALLAPGTLLAENVVKPFVSGISDTLRLSIIRVSVIVVAIGAILLALNPEASIYELVGEAYSATLVAAFIPLAVGLYSKKANAFGALTSIVLGILMWQYWEHYVTSEIPATFVGFVASAFGIVFGTLISRFIQKEEQLEKHHLETPITTV